MIVLHHAIFEDAAVAPVLVHVIPAPTQAEALHILNVHAKYDSFLRAALHGEMFNGMRLRVEIAWTNE